MLNLNVNEFADKVMQPGVVVLDVRTPQELAEGYIEGALDLDFNSEDFQIKIEALDKSKIYAVYCRSGNRSGRTIELMDSLGFQNICHLEGGMIDWVKKGMPTSPH